MPAGAAVVLVGEIRRFNDTFVLAGHETRRTWTCPAGTTVCDRACAPRRRFLTSDDGKRFASVMPANGNGERKECR
jgi:hypothetical protein